MHTHCLVLERVNVLLQVEHAPVGEVQAVQLEEHDVQTLFPGLYLPVLHLVGVVHFPLAKACVDLQPHIPRLGVFVVKVDLQAEQYPVLLQSVQLAGQGPHVLLPRLY